MKQKAVFLMTFVTNDRLQYFAQNNLRKRSASALGDRPFFIHSATFSNRGTTVPSANVTDSKNIFFGRTQTFPSP